MPKQSLNFQGDFWMQADATPSEGIGGILRLAPEVIKN